MSTYRLNEPVKHGSKEIEEVEVPEVVNFGHLVNSDQYNGVTAKAIAIVADQNNLPCELFAEGLSLSDSRYFARSLESAIQDTDTVDSDLDLTALEIDLDNPIDGIDKITFPEKVTGGLIFAIDEGVGNESEVILRAVAYCHNKTTDSKVDWFKFKKISGKDIGKVSAKVGYLLGK